MTVVNLFYQAVEQTVLPRLKIYAERLEHLQNVNFSETVIEMYHILDALKVL